MSKPAARIGDLYDDGDKQAIGSETVFFNNIGVARVDDLTEGHPCPLGGVWPPVKVITGSSTVFANNKPIARVGDKHDIHCCGPSCHFGEFITGSPNVFVGG